MNKILVPIDFTDISKYGTQLAVKVATYLKAPLHFLNVVPLPSHILLTNEGKIFEDGDFDTSIPKQLMQKNTAAMQNWVNTYYPGATWQVVYGQINDTICKVADKEAVSLIVLGTHAKSGIQEILQSSHGEYVAMHAKVPVLTLKCDRSDLTVKSIVLASSFRKPDVPHADMAIALQKAFNAKMYLLRIITPNDFIPDAEVENNMKIFAAEHGIENYEICIYNDKTVEDGIVHFVAKYDIDIITIGTNQRTGLNKIINGCVSADLVNHVYKPILTFKLKD
jgi:nucleotide-binding universal stress UspA family protein